MPPYHWALCIDLDYIYRIKEVKLKYVSLRVRLEKLTDAANDDQEKLEDDTQKLEELKTEKRNLKLAGFKIADFKEEVYNVKSVNQTTKDLKRSQE